ARVWRTAARRSTRTPPIGTCGTSTLIPSAPSARSPQALMAPAHGFSRGWRSFSSTTTRSGATPCALTRWSAVLVPAGPPPTIATSNRDVPGDATPVTRRSGRARRRAAAGAGSPDRAGASPTADPPPEGRSEGLAERVGPATLEQEPVPGLRPLEDGGLAQRPQGRARRGAPGGAEERVDGPARRLVGGLHGRQVGMGADVVGGQEQVLDLGPGLGPVGQ